jgi:AcrR family transcriptional regulator
MPVTKTTRRGPLSRERVLRTAVKIADKHGLDALSMRKLGDAVGVEAMSLYNYVACKDELLDGMADVVAADIRLPVEDADWRPAMLAWAKSVREVLGNHRWAIKLLGARTSPGPATLSLYDAVFGCLRRAGFSAELASDTFGLLNSFTFGFVVQEATVPFETGDQAAEHAQGVLNGLAEDEYPYLRDAIERVVKERTDPAQRFETGLELILDGIEQRFGAEVVGSKRTKAMSR